MRIRDELKTTISNRFDSFICHVMTINPPEKAHVKRYSIATLGVYHWGFILGSMTSLVREQIGKTISLLAMSWYSPTIRNLSARTAKLKKKTFLRQRLQDSVTGIESLHAFERTAVLVHDTIVIKDIDELQVVSLAALVIVGVMGRGNLDGTCER